MEYCLIKTEKFTLVTFTREKLTAKVEDFLKTATATQVNGGTAVVQVKGVTTIRTAAGSKVKC